jgi:Ca2+-binding RTX toxin-like protein
MGGRTVVGVLAAAVWAAAFGDSAAAQQSPTPGSAGREGSTLVVRNDGNPGQKTFRIANGAFYPSFLWLGNRPVNNNGVEQVEPAYGPGCELASPAEIDYGMVRCPLAGVTEVVVEMGSREGDWLVLLASGAAPTVRVRGGSRLDARGLEGAAAPALTALVREAALPGDDASAAFRPEELGRFEFAGTGGADRVNASGGDVRIDTGSGRDHVVAEGAGRSAEITLGAGNDFAHVRTRKGATSSIDGGAGRDILVSDDGERTAITCGSGHDSVSVTSADQPGAGCGVPLVGLEKYTGVATCPGTDVWRPCRNAPGGRAVKGTLKGNVLTIRALGRLPRKTLLSASVGTRTQLSRGEPLAAATSVRRPAGKLTLKLALTKKGRASLTPGKRGLKLMVGTGSRRVEGGELIVRDLPIRISR